jgi:Mrp family chromosome partitioning ATPase
MSMAVNEKLASAVSPGPLAAPRAVSAANSGPLRAEDMVNLYRSILDALPAATCRIIEITAATRGEGVSTVVRSLAETASSMANARVLVCDVTPNHDMVKYLGVSLQASLNDVAMGSADLSQAIANVPGRSFALCAANDPSPGVHVAVNLDVLDPVLAEIRKQFDLVLFDAPAIASGILGPALAKKADGVIMVVQAEQTRVPVIIEAQRIIEVNGGQVLGVVLNQRRFYVPRWVYRWI